MRPSPPAEFIPARLTEARVATAKTMRALAFECGLSPASVSAYESGGRTPTPETISRLAANLQMPVEYFLRERPFPVLAQGSVFFRSLTSARTRREQERRKQLACWDYEVSAWIDQFVELPKPDLPELQLPDESLEEHEVEKAAYDVRHHWGLALGPIPNVLRLLEQKGIFAVRQHIANRKLDAFSRVINGRPLLFLNSGKASAVRSRFDAAHELGHLILHQHLTQDELAHKETLDRVEREANLFASAFLLPEETFSRELYGLTLNAFVTHKRRWLVSVQGMITRCAHLGILDYDQERSLWVQISSRGWRTREPLDDEIQTERPTLGRKAWELIRNHPRIDISRRLRDLNLPPTVIANAIDIPVEQISSTIDDDKIVPINLPLRKTLPE